MPGYYLSPETAVMLDEQQKKEFTFNNTRLGINYLKTTEDGRYRKYDD